MFISRYALEQQLTCLQQGLDNVEQKAKKLTERAEQLRRTVAYLEMLGMTFTKPVGTCFLGHTDVFFARNIELGRKRTKKSPIRHLESFEGFRCAELTDDPKAMRDALPASQLGSPEEAECGKCPKCRSHTTYHIVTYDDESDHEGTDITTKLHRACFVCSNVETLGVRGQGRRNAYASPPRG